MIACSQEQLSRIHPSCLSVNFPWISKQKFFLLRIRAGIDASKPPSFEDAMEQVKQNASSMRVQPHSRPYPVFRYFQRYLSVTTT